MIIMLGVAQQVNFGAEKVRAYQMGVTDWTYLTRCFYR